MRDRGTLHLLGCQISKESIRFPSSYKPSWPQKSETSIFEEISPRSAPPPQLRENLIVCSEIWHATRSNVQHLACKVPSGSLCSVLSYDHTDALSSWSN